MTVKELKRILKEYPDTMQVILASDEEGNSFGQCSNIVGNHYYKGQTEVLCLYPETYIDGEDIEGDIAEPHFKPEWCELEKCDQDKDDVTFMPDGVCPCGVKKHHYHSNDCGHIIQIG